MKKIIMPLLVLLLFSVLLVAEALNNDSIRNYLLERLSSSGTATFGVRTVTYNGPYGPRNAGVIWVTDSNNQFVKTIKVWASNYRYTLRRWIASSNQNTTGAITSASLNSHQLHNVSWDGRNSQNTEVPDGTYKFNIEFTEHNATASNMGKYKQVSFVKGTEPVDLVIPNETYFRDMSLTWTPIITNGTISGRVLSTGGTPISGAVVTAGNQTDISSLSGEYTLSLVPGIYTLICSATGYISQNLDNVNVIAGQTSPLDITLGSVSNEDPNNSPAALFLSSPYPNPTRTYCKVNFRVKPAQPYELSVYNSRGQIMRRVSGVSSDTSLMELSWDGKDSHRQICPSGLYFIKLRSGEEQVIRRLTLSR
ncbi:MAG: DUF2271 domain-containing protein [Candidatus Cloacimonadota bacterium]